MRTDYHQDSLEAPVLPIGWPGETRRSDVVMHPKDCTEFAFRQFRVKPGSRELLRDGQPVEIGSRAFDLLVLLLACRGTVVSKAQIFRTVWVSTIVQEGNLRFQMTHLRKVLGADRDVIKTIPGRGYLFVAEKVEDGQGGGRSPTGRNAAQDLGAAVGAERMSRIIVIEKDRDVLARVSGGLRAAGFCVEAYGSVEAFRVGDRILEPAVRMLDA